MSRDAKQQVGLLAAIVLVLVVGTLVDARVASADTFLIWMLAMPIVMTAAMGQLPVILCGHVDISIGSLLALAAILVGMTFRAFPDMPIVLGFALGLGIGGALGLVNGLLVTVLRIHSIVVTLGTLSVYRGLTFLVSDSRQVDPNDLPAGLVRLSQVAEWAVPPIVLIALVAVGAAYWLVHRSGLGTLFLAVGSNARAAVLRGVPADRVVVLAFVASGALTGLAGVMFASRFGYVNPAATGTGFELAVISAVVIGGASIAGGRGTVVGCALGVLFVSLIEVVLPKVGVSRFWQDVIFGLVIVGALGIDRLLARSGGAKASAKAGAGASAGAPT